jgi:hypothetical protein
MGGLIGWLVATALVVVPMWKILERTGQPTWLALLLAVPVFGPILVAFVWGRGRWPRLPGA